MAPNTYSERMPGRLGKIHDPEWETYTYAKRDFFPVLPYAPNTYPKIKMESSCIFLNADAQ